MTKLLPAEWVEKTLNPSIARYMYIHASVNKLAKELHAETGEDPKKVAKSAMELPLLGLNSILDNLHRLLTQSQFIGGDKPDNVDREAFHSLHNAISKGILHLTENEKIDEWYKQCESQFTTGTKI